MLGTLAAAGLAGLMTAPRFLSPGTPLTGLPQAARAVASQAAAPATPPSAEIAATPSTPAQSVNLPSRAARARPKVREAMAPLVAQAAAPAPPAALEAAETGAVAGGVSAKEQYVAGSPSPVAPIAAAARIGANPAAALRQAAEVGDLATLEALVEKHTDVDSRDDAGRTALMLATLHGQADAVNALLAHGADPNAADASGTTPLQAATTAGNDPRIAVALRRYGAR